MDAVSAVKALRTEDGRRDPYPYYAAMHRDGAAVRIPEGEDKYTVAVFGHEAVDQVLRDPTFQVMDHVRMSVANPDWREHATLRVFLGSVMFANDPMHGRIRRLLNKVFTARRVANLEPPIVELTTRLLDRLEKKAEAGPVDFMSEFAYLLPSLVIGFMIGIPEQDMGWFRPLVDQVSDVLELGRGTPERFAIADAAAVRLTGYFTELAADRRANPRDDLITSLVQANDADTDQLSDEELMANLVVLFNAGFVTTINMFGNGVTMLLDRPELVERLLAQPETAPGFVDEIVRFDVPTHFVIRYATAETDVAGVHVVPGDRVLVLLAAANHDPARHAEPGTFDPTRPLRASMAFGAGAHFCLGAALARLEGVVGFPLLFQRFPKLSLAEPPVPMGRLMLRGHAKL
ncbi:MAG: cytochrome P450, partial [Actinocatenispora sp.]